MTTAAEKYSLTENQIVEARIPLITNAVPNVNLKLLPERLVREYALTIYGSMANIRLAFEQNRQVKMEKYEIQHARWTRESNSFEEWVHTVKPIWGENWGRWPENAREYYIWQRDRLKKKPKRPRQTFEANGTTTASREAATKKHLTRKAK